MACGLGLRGAGHERGGGGQQPLQQAHGAAADGDRRQLRAHPRLLRRHCGERLSLSSGFEALLRKQFELAIGIEQTCNFPL